MYKVATLTPDQLKRIDPAVAAEIEALRQKSDNFDPDPDYYAVWKELDNELYETAQLYLDAPKSAPASTSAKAAQEPDEKGKRGRPATKPEPRKKAPAAAADPSKLKFREGQAVTASVKGEEVAGTIKTLPKTENRMYYVTFNRGGGQLIHEDKIHGGAPKGDTAPKQVDHMDPLPASLVDAAIVAKRTDCKEGEVLIIKPTEKVEITTPNVADPANGDVILANPDGTPMTVIKGEELGKHYEPVAEAEVSTNKDGTAKIEKEPEPKGKKAAKGESATPAPTKRKKKGDDGVKPTKPTATCTITNKAEYEPALAVVLEGLVRRYKSGDSDDKLLRVLHMRKTDKIVLEMKIMGVGLSRLTGGRVVYFEVCLKSGKLTKIAKPEPRSYKVEMDEAQVKMLHYGNIARSCNAYAARLYKECYRKGNCSDREKKVLYQALAQRCRKRDTELNVGHQKWTHQQARQRWKDYTGEKSYFDVWKETLADIRKSGTQA